MDRFATRPPLGCVIGGQMMTSTPRILAITVALAACFVTGGCATGGAAAAPAEAEPPRDGVFIHITTGPEYPQKALMALSMANMMADDHDVLVYFDIEGVNLVTEDAPNISHERFPSLHDQLAELAAKNVGLYACPACLAAAGKTPADLRKGVAIASRQAFFRFTEGQILTLDY